jgi:iron complex outermembrane receptor protein
MREIANSNNSRRLVRITLLLLSALVAIGQANASAQELRSLSGRVTDANGAALQGATVTLFARATSAPRMKSVTDSNGNYRFDRLAPGDYLVEAEAAGFAPAVARELTVQSEAATNADFRLEVAGVRAEVVVTASDSPQAVDEVSKAVNVIGKRELDERNEYSIPDALLTVPGLRIRRLGGPGTLTTIRTRGLRNEDTAVLIDGMRLRDPSAPQGDASSLIGDLVVTDVSRIEVLRGSGSSLYGTNAIGGTINLITDEGGGRFRSNVLGEGGSLGLFRARGQFSGGAGNADRFVYSGGISHLNIARGVDGDDAARNTSAQGRATFYFTPSVALSGRVYFSDSFVELNRDPEPVGPTPSGVVDAVILSPDDLRQFEAGAPLSQFNGGATNLLPSRNNPLAHQDGRFFSGALMFTHRLNDDASYAISYHGLDVTRANIDTGANTRFDFDGRIHTLNVRADFSAGANHVTAGYEFEHEDFFNFFFFNDPSFDSGTGATETTHAIFAQDQLRLLDDQLQFSAAFRAQFFSLDDPRFEPAGSSPFPGPFVSPPTAYTGDGSAAYFIRSTNTKLRAHVGNGYRAPSLFERFGASFFFGSFFPFGNPRLRPERSIAVDGGIDQSLFENRLRASATYFYTRLQEVIVFDLPYRNTGGALARGVELSLEAAPSASTNIFASYTHTNSDQRVPQALGVISSYVIPDHQFSLVLGQRVGRRLLFNFDVAASSNYLAPVFDPVTFGTRVYRFDGLLKADFGGSYTLPLSDSRSIRFFGLIENLFDREYYEAGFRTQGIGARAGAAISF